jgi:hypothetical protein
VGFLFLAATGFGWRSPFPFTFFSAMTESVFFIADPGSSFFFLALACIPSGILVTVPLTVRHTS